MFHSQFPTREWLFETARILILKLQRIIDTWKGHHRLRTMTEWRTVLELADVAAAFQSIPINVTSPMQHSVQ